MVAALLLLCFWVLVELMLGGLPTEGEATVVPALPAVSSESDCRGDCVNDRLVFVVVVADRLVKSRIVA